MKPYALPPLHLGRARKMPASKTVLPEVPVGAVLKWMSEKDQPSVPMPLLISGETLTCYWGCFCQENGVWSAVEYPVLKDRFLFYDTLPEAVLAFRAYHEKAVTDCVIDASNWYTDDTHMALADPECPTCGGTGMLMRPAFTDTYAGRPCSCAEGRG